MSAPDSKRNKPYVWVSWITKLLSGDDVCEWKSWYKAHFRYAKREDDGPDIADWTRQHDEMTAARAAKLRGEGYVVHVEEANAFKLDGKVATLAGKPDIVAVKADDRRAKVVDEKSGKRRESDFWQVRVYLFALPLAFTKFKSWALEGALDYRNGLVDVGELDRQHVERISDVMRIVGGDDEPARTPSARECRFCNILNCPERVEAEAATADASRFF